MSILETYLLYLMLQEREWNTPTENPDSFDIKHFQDVFGKKVNLGILSKMRHALQPSMYHLYIKNMFGDYMGRPDTMNSQTMRHLGFLQFKKDIEKLKAAMKFAQKMKEKIPDNFFGLVSRHGETSDPGDSGDGGDGGGDGGGGD